MFLEYTKQMEHNKAVSADNALFGIGTQLSLLVVQDYGVYFIVLGLGPKN